MPEEPRIALVTGATQGLGLALVEGLARRLGPDDIVYLTGRNAERTTVAAEKLQGLTAQVRAETLDVSDTAAVDSLATELKQRHGGVDIVYSNAVMRVGPSDRSEDIVEEYADINNFGTTRILRAFLPLIRRNGRMFVVASSLGSLSYLAPILHKRFDGLDTLDDVDKSVADWRDAVKDGSARRSAWPAFVNIPSKIAQVAAVRAVASSRRESDLAQGILVAAICPGMMNTPTSGVWWDVSDAASPADAAVPIIDIALDSINPNFYGELIRDHGVLPWAPWR